MKRTRAVWAVLLALIVCAPAYALALPCTIVPARKTAVAEIGENLSKIDAVQRSALDAIAALLVSGEIISSDAARRASVLKNAFADYRFAWMTKTVQKYWTRAYGTKKDFFPGTVYYGLPYIQKGRNGADVNRRYNVRAALAQGNYRDTGKGYYLLNTAKNRGGMYVGSDCSSFVGMAMWGRNTRGLMRTSQIATSGLYKTLKGFEQLRPGDIIVREHDHALFFLYFVDPAKTNMMVLEQGGDKAGDLHATVTCSITGVSPYVKKKYKPRRLAGLGR